MTVLVVVPVAVWVALLVAICACVVAADLAVDGGDLGAVRACGALLVAICVLALALYAASAPDGRRDVDWDEVHAHAEEVQD